MEKVDAEVVREIFQSVEQSNKKVKRLKSSTFWRLFDVRARQKTVVNRIAQLLEAQGLKVSVKSGEPLGEERDDDWVVVTKRLSQPPLNPPPLCQVKLPSAQWFEMMTSRNFESEREVEAFFVSELLDQLGYDFDDIVIGYPVKLFKGVQKITAEADFAVFNGPDRDKKSVLLVIEAKKGDKGITVDHVSQAKSYAQELLPACYVVTNGQEIKVFQFNGVLAPDDCVMNFDRTQLKEQWPELCKYISKEATIKRKEWISSRLAA